MNMVEAFESLFTTLRPHFYRVETFNRARELAYAHLVTYGRRTISRVICSKNQQQQDWSADYKFFSQRKWDAHDLFFEILKECDSHSHWYQNAVVMAMDESFRKKRGKKIPKCHILRDPMSLPYHANLIPAIRFLQASAIINPQDNIEVSRAIPILFKEAAPAKKPGRKATEEQQAQYKKQKVQRRIAVIAGKALFKLREQVDRLPGKDQRLLILTVDGSFCNRHFLRKLPPNTVVIARARKDMKLFRPFAHPHSGPQGGRYRIYGERLPTPDEIRRNDSFPWHTAEVYAAGKYHQLRYKVVSPVLWKNGTAGMRCRLFIIAPLRYRKSPNSRLLYRNPAYLLVTNEDIPDHYILQYYFLRWDIEVNHRDEKSVIGLGAAQVRSPKSVPRNPQFTAIIYSLLLLASIRAYGPFRTNDYPDSPKWAKSKHRQNRRPSTQDIISLFRAQIMEMQLHINLKQSIQEEAKKRKKKRKKKKNVLRTTRKNSFVNSLGREQKPIKLPVNILAAILYAHA